MLYLDYKSHLQTKLNAIANNHFVVTNLLNMKANLEKVNVIIKELAGNVYENSATLPVQLDVYTKDVEDTMSKLNSFVSANNNIGFQNDSYYITSFYTTPVMMESDTQMGNNFYSRIVVFGNLYVLFAVSNIKEIYIGDEKIDFLNASVTYTTELYSDRQPQTNQINFNRKRTANVSLTFTTINKTGIFANKLRALRTGGLDGNYVFEVTLVYVEGNTEETYYMIVNNVQSTFARNQLPNLQVAMISAQPNAGV